MADIFDQVAGGGQPQPKGDIFDQVSGGDIFDQVAGPSEGVLPHLSRRWTEGNRGVARADAGTQLAAVENYDVQGAAQDFARLRLPGDVEPASSAFLTEQAGNRQRFMEQKALLGGDVNPQQARQSSALDAFETARNAKSNALMAEINANSPQPTESGQVGPITQFVGDVVGNVPRLARTMGVGVATGGFGAVPYMAEQIFGESYAGYRQKGKEPERAAIAAGINALAQAPLEYLPSKKLLDMLGSKGGKLAGIVKVMASEGLTEYAQAYPDEFADIYVDNPDASAGQLAKMFWEKFKTGEFHKKALYEGAVGAVTGGGLAGVAAGTQRLAQGKQAQPLAPTGAESLHVVGDNQDADLARRIVGPESGGDPNAKNPNSTAQGLGQFTKATRDSMLARHGVDAYSADPAEQMKAIEILTRENRDALTKGLGRAPTDGEIYTAHFLGSGGALQFLGALQASPDDAAVNHVSPAAARANQGVFYNKDGSAKTVAEVAASLAGKVGQGEAVAQSGVKGDVFDAVAQQEQPEGALGPISPELASLKEDIKERLPEISADPVWEVSTVQEAAGKAAGVPQNMARENELRSLRAEIQSREVRARVVEEQGATLPVREAMRMQETPALPQGQGFEVLPTQAQPDPATIPLQNLVFVAKDLGIERPSKMTRPALIEAVRQAQAEQMRATVQAPQDMRVQFRPEARTPAQFADADTMLAGPDTRFSAANRPAGGRLSTRDVSTATASYERAMPGAAPTRILQSAQELPAHIQEQAREAGYSLNQVRGVHDTRTGSVYLVADNLIDPAEAGRIWLHEQLAHHGLRELFGSSAKFRSVLENVRKSYGLGSIREAEEHIAQIAEQLDAGKALSPRDGFYWRKVVDSVRAWLAEHGISVSRANLEAMLRKSARNLAKGGEQQGHGMQEAAAFSGERQFLESPTGGYDFGSIPQEIASQWGGKAAPIRLERGDGQTGASHIIRDHGSQIRALGYRTVQEFVADTVKRFDAVFKGEGRAVFLVARDSRPWKTALIKMEYDPAGDYYTVKTAMPTREAYFVGKDGAEKKRLLWERAQTNHPTGETPGAPGAISGQRSLSDEKITPFSPDDKGEANFSIRDAKLSDYQKDRLSHGAKLKDFDLKRMFGIARMLFIDRTAPALDMAAQAGGKSVAREFDKQSRRQAGVQGIVDDMVSENGSGVATYGVQGEEMEVIPGSKTLGQALTPLKNNEQRYVDFNSYMIARREVALVERNEKTLAELEKVNKEIADVSKDVRSETDPARRAKLARIEKGLRQEATDLRAKIVSNLDEVKATIELQRLESVYGPQGIRQFEAMHKDMVKWLDQAVLKPRLDAGLLSQDAYDAITKGPEHEVYAAFQREIERDGVVTVGGNGGPKRIKGSDRKIIAPVESAVAAVVRTVREVEQAKTNQMLVDLANVNPEIAEVITPAKQPGRGTITTHQNGVAKHWSVPWEVAAGLNGLSPEAARIIRYVGNATLLRPAAQLMRMGTTVFSLAFSIRNIVRDQVHATAMSKHGYNPAKFVGGLVEYLKDATGKDSQAMREWRRSGGETGIYTAMEQSQVELTVKDLLGFGRRTAGGQALRFATSPFRAIRWVGEAGEKATRVALYQNVRKKGASASDAMLESRDTTVDFSRIGLAGQVINQIIPFWNANVQGLSKMGRTIKERPGRFALNVLLGITAPSILEWAAYHDEEWWKNLQAWEKDMFWHVKAGDAIIRIPKPFEVGVLFGSLPVRVLEWWDTNDANGMWKVGKAIKDGMTPPLSNPLVTPLLENATNHSFMSDRPLESKSMDNLQPWMRYNSTTSELSKEVGKLFDISPIKMDNWIRGQMGTVGRDVSKALDAPINALRGKDSPPSPSKPWYEQVPGVSGFISREPIGSRSEPVNDFYTNMERTSQAASTRAALSDAGNTTDAGRIDAKDAFFAPAFKKASSDIADMRKEIAAVNESMDMGPDAKRAKIDEIERNMTRRAWELNAAYNRNKPTPEALFLGTKAQVNAARSAYDEAQKSGRRDEAARIARESDLSRLLPIVKAASSRLSQIESARNKLNDNPKLDTATRKRWLDKLDEQEAQVLNAFKRMQGGRR